MWGKQVATNLLSVIKRTSYVQIQYSRRNLRLVYMTVKYKLLVHHKLSKRFRVD